MSIGSLRRVALTDVGPPRRLRETECCYSPSWPRSGLARATAFAPTNGRRDPRTPTSEGASLIESPHQVVVWAQLPLPSSQYSSSGVAVPTPIGLGWFLAVTMLVYLWRLPSSITSPRSDPSRAHGDIRGHREGRCDIPEGARSRPTPVLFERSVPAHRMVAGLVWMTLAWVVSLPIVTLPVGILMMNRVGGVMTLLRY